MTITARVLADSVNPRGARLTTFVLRYPRYVHAEFMTHRAFSRNAASSRAVPFPKALARVMEDPAMPLVWGKNQSGMVAAGPLPDILPDTPDGWSMPQYDRLTKGWAEGKWLGARDSAAHYATDLYADGEGLHKQHVSRIIEPWSHIEVVCSATALGNWYHLRMAPDAMPEMQALAKAMQHAQDNSVPVYREACHRSPWADLTPPDDKDPRLTFSGHMPPSASPWDTADPEIIAAWHLPFVTDEERLDPSLFRGQAPHTLRTLIYLSTGRCCRVSYLTHEGTREPIKDIALAATEIRKGHWSPTEHQACVPAGPFAGTHGGPTWHGNFWDWVQARKLYSNEHPADFYRKPYSGPVKRSEHQTAEQGHLDKDAGGVLWPSDLDMMGKP
jgi:hypothetical protein